MDTNVNYERYLTSMGEKKKYWRVEVPIPSPGIKRCVYEKLGDFVDKERARTVVQEYFKGCLKDSKAATELALRIRIRELESECESWRERAREWKRERELEEVI